MLLDRLAKQLEAEQEEIGPSLLAQILLLYAALENPDSPRARSLASNVAALGMVAYARAFRLAGEEQLKRLTTRPRSALSRGDDLARPFGVLMRSRALSVLAKPQTERQLVAYARTLSDVSVTFGSRAGFETVGKASGARFKTLERMKRVREPRRHSLLEGQTLPVGQNFLIDGYSVPGPAHPSLPLRSRLWCGHCLVYS